MCATGPPRHLKGPHITDDDMLRGSRNVATFSMFLRPLHGARPGRRLAATLTSSYTLLLRRPGQTRRMMTGPGVKDQDQDAVLGLVQRLIPPMSPKLHKGQAGELTGGCSRS